MKSLDRPLTPGPTAPQRLQKPFSVTTSSDILAAVILTAAKLCFLCASSVEFRSR